MLWRTFRSGVRVLRDGSTPKSHGRIRAPRSEGHAIGREGEGQHTGFVTDESKQFLAGGQVPELHAAHITGGQRFSIQRRNGQCHYFVGLAPESRLLSSSQIPNSNGGIDTAGDQSVTIRSECQGADGMSELQAPEASPAGQ